MTYDLIDDVGVHPRAAVRVMATWSIMAVNDQLQTSGERIILRPMKAQVTLFLLLLASCGQVPPSTTEETLEQFVKRIKAYPPPSRALVDRVEHRLSASPCIDDISTWNRLYTYGLPSRTVDETRIAFRLKKAGHAGVLAGRRVGFPGETLGIDDTPVRIAWGSFNRRTDRLKIEFCGDNMGG